jgi:hypothetical protein
MQLGWVDHCAYIAGSGGIGVIDVSAPTNPRELEILHGRGADRAR